MESVIIEHNEAKIKDITIPLFALEQRVDKLEEAFSTYQLDNVGFLANAVADRFKNSFREFMPKLHNTIEEFKQFKSSFEMT